MLKIKNTKHLDTAEEIFTEFLDKFQKYAADCDDCRRPERDNPLWWLGLPAAEFPYSRRGVGANVRPRKNRRYQRVERLRRSHK